MKKYLIQTFLAILFFSLCISAKNIDTPYVVDVFGKINSEELTARLDNYVVEYKKYKNGIAGILISRGEKDPLGFQYRYATRIKSYLTKIRGVPSNKVIIVQIGKADYTRVTLYLVPFGSEKGLIDNGKTDFEDEYDSSKTFLFDSYDFTDDVGTCCIVDNFTKEESASSLTAISEIIKKIPDSKIYLTAYGCKQCQNYGDSKIDSLQSVDKILKESKEFLSKNGIENSRIITINGGYNKNYRRIDVWFVPKDSQIPKPKPDYFPKKKRSKK